MKSAALMLFAALILPVAPWSVVTAQTSETVSGTATINVTGGIAISESQTLHFGDIVPQNGGFVIIDPATGNASTTGTLILLGANHQGTFTVTGEANRAYDITLPSGSIDLSNGSDTIKVDKFTSDPNASGTLSASGTQTLNIGARAKISNGQGFGWYTATYPVTVTLQ